ncbi:MAG: site-specific integrase, partial [Neisseriaceae bacterium]
LLLEQIEVYLARQDLRPSSLKNLLSAIKIHLIPYFDNIDIHSITVLDLESFAKTLKFSPTQVRIILRPLKEIFKRSLRNSIIRENPFSSFDVDILRQSAVKTDYQVEPFTIAEINLILNNCEHACIRNIIQTGFYTGMRPGEMFALTWDDVDFSNEQINVNKTVSFGGVINAPKTKAGIRSVEMIAEAKEALLSQFELTGKSLNKRVFTTPRGATWKKPDSLGRFWKQAILKAGVKYRNPYQMRHTFISYMLSRGNNPLILYQMVGHEDVSIMYKHYARFINNSGRKLLV